MVKIRGPILTYKLSELIIKDSKSSKRVIALIKRDMTAFKIFPELYNKNLIIIKIKHEINKHLIIINTYIPNEPHSLKDEIYRAS